MPTTKYVQDLTALGTITSGDKLVGERVAGQTRLLTYGVDITLDLAPELGGNLSVGSASYSIVDSNANELFKFIKVASAINELTITNASIGTAPSLSASGDDTNIDLNLVGKGSGVVTAKTTSNSILVANTGTAYQHTTVIAAANTAASRTATLQDADGTVAYTNVANYGTGATSFTAYAPVVGGTTATGALQSSAAGTAGQLYQSAGASAVPTWTTPTYPSASGTSGKVLQSDGTNLVYSTSTFPTTSATALKYLRSDGTNWIASTATISDTPSTAGKVLISDGTNWITSTPTFPNASATSGKIIKSDGTNWTASTETYAAPGTSGKVLVSDGTNWVNSTPTFPNASATSRKIIVSDGTNWTASTETYATPGTSGNIMQSNGTNWASATPSATPSASGIALWDANSNLSAANFLEGYTSTATAAGTTTLVVGSNRQQVFTGATTQTCRLPVVSTLALGTLYTITNLSSGVVTVQSSGTNTVQAMAANTTLIVQSNATSGTGASVWNVVLYVAAASDITGSGLSVRATTPTINQANLVGTTTNDSAAAGSVGEVISSTVTSGSAVSLTTVTAANITSISLTAGDWDLSWTLAFVTASTTSLTDVRGSSSTTSATLATPGALDHPYTINQYNAFVPGVTTFCFGGGCQGRISIGSTTTVYLVARGTFTVSTLSSYGAIWARRVR